MQERRRFADRFLSTLVNECVVGFVIVLIIFFVMLVGSSQYIISEAKEIYTEMAINQSRLEVENKSLLLEIRSCSLEYRLDGTVCSLIKEGISTNNNDKEESKSGK